MIKKLTIDYKEDVQNLFLSVFSKPPWNDVWDLEEQLPKYMTDLMDNQNSLCLGYYQEDQLIGISLGYVFHWWEGTDYFIKEFCIDSELQGAGHGKRFLDEMNELLKSESIKAIWLMTERTTPAYSFYQKNGFFELKDNVMFAKSVNS